MKKLLSIILSILMLMSITAGLDFSAYAKTYTFNDYLSYSVLSDGTVQIDGFIHVESELWKYSDSVDFKNVTLPSTLDGKKVTSLGERAFDSCWGGGDVMENITVPKTVKNISEYALFQGETNLISVTILNPDCKIYDDEDTIYSGNKKFVICGYAGSTAEKYAKKYGYKFKKLFDGKITLSDTSFTYDGKVKKPTVTVKDNKGKKIASSNYTVSYASGCKNVGEYKVTVTFSGAYSGTSDLYFTINPKATSVSSVKATKKAFTVKWKKQSKQTTGYEIQYSTDKSFKKNNNTKVIKKNSTTSTTIKKLKGKKKYYVRVRAYKTVSGKKYYSAWSKSKSVTTKK